MHSIRLRRKGERGSGGSWWTQAFRFHCGGDGVGNAEPYFATNSRAGSAGETVLVHAARAHHTPIRPRGAGKWKVVPDRSSEHPIAFCSRNLNALLFSSGRYDWSVNFAFCRFWRYSCWNAKRACDRSFAEPSTRSDFLRGKRAHLKRATQFQLWVTTNDFGPEFSSAMK